MNNRLDPVNGNIFPVFFYYSIPSVFGILAMSCAVVIDGVFLGNYAGTTALASVNLTIPVSGLLFGLALMLSVGGAVRCGKYLGKGNQKAANSSFSQTIAFVVLLAIFLSILGIGCMDQVIFLIGAHGEMAGYASEYLHIIFFFTVFQLGSICLSYFVRVAGFPFRAALAMTGGSLLNIALDWLFVVSLAMGHQGAALATGLAATVTFLLLCPPFFTQCSPLRFNWRRRDVHEVFKAAANGFPELIDELSVGIVIIIFNWIIMKKMGANGIAAFSIVNYMILSGLVISYGLSDSLQSMVSRNFGALREKRIRKVLLLASGLVSLVGIAISFLLVMVPQAVSGFFIAAEERETIQLTNDFVSRVWPVFLANGLNIVLASYMTAMNKSLDSTLMILAKNLLLPILLLFVIHVIIGREAILIVLPLSEMITLILGIYLIRKNSPENLVEIAIENNSIRA